MATFKYGTSAWGIYPGVNDAFNFVKVFKVWREAQPPPEPSFLTVPWGPYLELKATLLGPHFFTVQMRWKAVIEYAELIELTGFEFFRGWIWYFLPWSGEWTLMVDSTRDGEALFWELHDKIKH